MATQTRDAEVTQELRQQEDTHYVLEVSLDDGEQVHADVGTDRDAARTQLTSLHQTGVSDAFVFLGSDTVVRSRDVRYVRIREVGVRGGDSWIARRREGYDMTTYETERGSRSTRARSSDGEGRGFFDDPGIGYGRRPWSETKPFFLTSEFLALLGIIAGIAIAMGTLDNFDAPRGWLLITIIGAAYMVARGIAKSGTRDPNPRDYNRD